MSDVCKLAKCAKTCTPHCLRATAITTMSDEGFEARQVMYMSGHMQVRKSSKNLQQSCPPIKRNPWVRVYHCLLILKFAIQIFILQHPPRLHLRLFFVSPREHSELHAFDISKFNHLAIDSSSSARAMKSFVSSLNFRPMSYHYYGCIYIPQNSSHIYSKLFVR